MMVVRITRLITPLALVVSMSCVAGENGTKLAPVPADLSEITAPGIELDKIMSPRALKSMCASLETQWPVIDLDTAPKDVIANWRRALNSCPGLKTKVRGSSPSDLSQAAAKQESK